MDASFFFFLPSSNSSPLKKGVVPVARERHKMGVADVPLLINVMLGVGRLSGSLQVNFNASGKISFEIPLFLAYYTVGTFTNITASPLIR